MIRKTIESIALGYFVTRFALTFVLAFGAFAKFTEDGSLTGYDVVRPAFMSMFWAFVLYKGIRMIFSMLDDWVIARKRRERELSGKTD